MRIHPIARRTENKSMFHNGAQKFPITSAILRRLKSYPVLIPTSKHLKDRPAHSRVRLGTKIHIEPLLARPRLPSRLRDRFRRESRRRRRRTQAKRKRRDPRMRLGYIRCKPVNHISREKILSKCIARETSLSSSLSDLAKPSSRSRPNSCYAV